MTDARAPRLQLEDVAVLEQRAAALARPDDAGEGAGSLVRLVAFTLGGRPCAVEADRVERVVSRLATPVPVPLAAGGERTVAFVEERAVPVVDLAGHARGAPRGGGALSGRPALVVATEAGPVAVVVDGPLDLLEDRLAAVAAGQDDAAVRVAGRLASGAELLDGGWLAAWAGASCAT